MALQTWRESARVLCTYQILPWNVNDDLKKITYIFTTQQNTQEQFSCYVLLQPPYTQSSDYVHRCIRSHGYSYCNTYHFMIDEGVKVNEWRLYIEGRESYVCRSERSRKQGFFRGSCKTLIQGLVWYDVVWCQGKEGRDKSGGEVGGVLTLSATWLLHMCSTWLICGKWRIVTPSPKKKKEEGFICSLMILLLVFFRNPPAFV